MELHWKVHVSCVSESVERVIQRLMRFVDPSHSCDLIILLLARRRKDENEVWINDDEISTNALYIVEYTQYYFHINDMLNVLFISTKKYNFIFLTHSEYKQSWNSFTNVIYNNPWKKIKSIDGNVS